MAEAPYPIIDASDWPTVADEPQGGKKKRWLREPSTGRHWLFKDRAQGGDDWAEKVAGEVAALLGIPHAEVELAIVGDTPGMISLDFTDRRRRGTLVLGNDLLLAQDPDYPTGDRFRVSAHTVDRVLGVLSLGAIRPDPTLPPELGRAPQVFIAYLLLDALIGNTDRHHENWGVLQQAPDATTPGALLAPSFDHAASLGQILSDEERQRRLETRDAGYGVAAYVRRARSALYERPEDKRPLPLLAAFTLAGRGDPEAARHWLQRLANVPRSALAATVERVPAQRATGWARRFACEVLSCNLAELSKVTLS